MASYKMKPITTTLPPPHKISNIASKLNINHCVLVFVLSTSGCAIPMASSQTRAEKEIAVKMQYIAAGRKNPREDRVKLRDFMKGHPENCFSKGEAIACSTVSTMRDISSNVEHFAVNQLIILGSEKMCPRFLWQALRPWPLEVIAF